MSCHVLQQRPGAIIASIVASTVMLLHCGNACRCRRIRKSLITRGKKVLQPQSHEKWDADPVVSRAACLSPRVMGGKPIETTSILRLPQISCEFSTKDSAYAKNRSTSGGFVEATSALQSPDNMRLCEMNYILQHDQLRLNAPKCSM